MHLFPRKKDEWPGFGLFLCKVYIAFGFAIWKLCNFYIDGDSELFATFNSSNLALVIGSGYIVSILILLFYAGVQIGSGRRKNAVQLFLFVGLGILFLLLGCGISFSFLSSAGTATALVVNGVVLYFVSMAQRHFK